MSRSKLIPRSPPESPRSTPILTNTIVHTDIDDDELDQMLNDITTRRIVPSLTSRSNSSIETISRARVSEGKEAKKHAKKEEKKRNKIIKNKVNKKTSETKTVIRGRKKELNVSKSHSTDSPGTKRSRSRSRSKSRSRNGGGGRGRSRSRSRGGGGGRSKSRSRGGGGGRSRSRSRSRSKQKGEEGERKEKSKLKQKRRSRSRSPSGSRSSSLAEVGFVAESPIEVSKLTESERKWFVQHSGPVYALMKLWGYWCGPECEHVGFEKETHSEGLFHTQRFSDPVFRTLRQLSERSHWSGSIHVTMHGIYGVMNRRLPPQYQATARYQSVLSRFFSEAEVVAPGLIGFLSSLDIGATSSRALAILVTCLNALVHISKSDPQHPAEGAIKAESEVYVLLTRLRNYDPDVSEKPPTLLEFEHDQ